LSPVNSFFSDCCKSFYEALTCMSCSLDHLYVLSSSYFYEQINDDDDNVV